MRLINLMLAIVLAHLDGVMMDNVSVKTDMVAIIVHALLALMEIYVAMEFAQRLDVHVILVLLVILVNVQPLLNLFVLEMDIVWMKAVSVISDMVALIVLVCLQRMVLFALDMGFVIILDNVNVTRAIMVVLAVLLAL